MKRTLIFAVSLLLLCTNTYAKTSCNIQRAYWQNPTVITHPWISGFGHDSVTGKPDQTFWIKNKKKSNNADDEAIVIVYMARKIVQRGGYFCATQLRSRNKGRSGCPTIWTQYQNPVGNIDNTCFWLCEPGYSGENCTAKDHPTTADCKYTQLSKQTIADIVDYQETGGLDTASVEANLKINCTGMLEYDYGTDSGDESDLVLAAKSFLENGHGIIASPATVSAHGGWWMDENYNDEHTSCTGGVSNITITANGTNYITKTLCMPGFSGPGCTTTMCRECEDPLTKYNDSTGSCSDCIENHVHDTNGNCVQCADGETADQTTNQCLKCAATEFVKNGKCTPGTPISKQRIYSCWPNSDFSDFNACIQDKCDSNITPYTKCITENRQIGTKICKSGVWTNCVSNKKSSKK